MNKMKLFYYRYLFVFWIVINGNSLPWYHHGLYKYFASNNKLNFTGTRSHCRDINADMVMIKSKDVQKFLKNLFSNGSNQYLNYIKTSK